MKRFKAGFDLLQNRLFSRLDRQDNEGIILSQLVNTASDDILIRDVFPCPVIIFLKTLPCGPDVALIREPSVLVDCTVLAVLGKVDVVHKAAKATIFIRSAFLKVHPPKVIIVLNSGNKVIAVEIIGKIDEACQVSDFIAAAIHDCHKLLLLCNRHLIQARGEIIERVKVFILTKELRDTVNGAIVVGNEPFLIYMACTVIAPNPDALKDFFHLVFGGGQFHPLTDKASFIVLAKIGDKHFQAIVQQRHKSDPPLSQSAWSPGQSRLPQTRHHSSLPAFLLS